MPPSLAIVTESTSRDYLQYSSNGEIERALDDNVIEKAELVLDVVSKIIERRFDILKDIELARIRSSS